MAITLNGTTGITSTGGYSSDGISFADDTPSNTLVTTTGGNVGIGTSSPARKLHVHESTAGTNAYIQLSNAATGTTSTDGFQAIVGTSGEVILAQRENSQMEFWTNNAERARITADGLFRATTTGSYLGDACHQLGVSNANSYGLIVFNTSASPASEYLLESRYTGSTPNNTSARFFNCADATNSKMYVWTNGGIANYSGNNSNLSDAREKTNVELAGSYLDKICAIPVKTFNYIDQNLEEDAGLTLGVIAQDVQAVAPELVSENDWGTQEEPKMRLSIYQTDLQYALMKCIQEQQAIITDLKSRIEALEQA